MAFLFLSYKWDWEGLFNLSKIVKVAGADSQCICLIQLLVHFCISPRMCFPRGLVWHICLSITCHESYYFSHKIFLSWEARTIPVVWWDWEGNWTVLFSEGCWPNGKASQWKLPIVLGEQRKTESRLRQNPEDSAWTPFWRWSHGKALRCPWSRECTYELNNGGRSLWVPEEAAGNGGSGLVKN